MSNEIEAEKAFQSALELMKHDHVETANIFDTLGENYLSRGNLAKALGARMKALMLREKHLGEDSLTATSINQVGFVYYMMGDYDFAKEEFQKAVDIYTKLGDKGIHLAACYHNLANTYCALGSDSDLKLARSFCQQAVVMRQALLGQHVDTAASSVNSEGCIHAKMDDNESAAKAFQKASEMRSNLLGDHKDTALSYYCLVDAQCNVGDFKGGLISFQKASRMRKALLGDHPDTAESFFFLGRTHCKLGDTKSAVEAFKEESRIRSNLLANHEGTAPIKSYQDTALSYHRLGAAQYELGDLNGALESSQKASRMRKEVLGDHPDTAESFELLNRVCDALSAKSLNELDCD